MANLFECFGDSLMGTADFMVLLIGKGDKSKLINILTYQNENEEENF